MIRQYGPITDRELVTRTGYPINVICARRNALLKQGWIVSAGTRIGRANVKNTVWVLAEK